ncbi:hypothetical protein M378DRAFT_159126 [Amanita muscaria Koide BX008]|uniref:Uncharacterized protein n=1 Tax=Amanita muscaria (strain Koide BX008) TaxID=946122 RepID=A0A0C2X1B4_AMAMK|nr:hypothetical protein M378DRAFT_159126 [Amanita muscaria Koide BX008]
MLNIRHSIELNIFRSGRDHWPDDLQLIKFNRQTCYFCQAYDRRFPQTTRIHASALQRTWRIMVYSFRHRLSFRPEMMM